MGKYSGNYNNNSHHHNHHKKQTQPRFSYLDFAENDYQFFMQCYRAGFVSNAMAVTASQAIEKYLKHLVVVSTGCNMRNMPDWVGNHNIPRMMDELYKRNLVDIDYATHRAIETIKRYFYAARYPDLPDSLIVGVNEIEQCKLGLIICRNLTMNYLKDREEKTNQNYEENIEDGFER